MFCRAFSKVGNISKVNNLYAFQLNQISAKLCSNTNINDNSQITKEIVKEDNGFSENYEEGIKLKILQSSLPFVSQHGWSRDTLAAGADELGYPDTVHGLFRDPGAELALYFYSLSNNSLSLLLKNGSLKCSKKNKAELVDFLSSTIKARLFMIEPYLNQWPQAIALLSKPSNAPNALSNLMTLVDDICYHAGDRSIDTRWYTRRIGLATVYKSSELHLLQDKSQEYKDTWSFVRRAIEECVKLDTMLESNAQLAKDVVNASVSTLEDAICSILSKTKIQRNVLFLILDHLKTDRFKIKLLGCEEHANTLTKNITIFYIQSRMYFSCNIENARREKNKKQKKFGQTI